MNKINYDVVVIGGGLAGLCCGIRAAEIGSSVVIIEQGSEDYLCNSRLTGGLFHIAMDDMTADSEIILNNLNKVTKGVENKVLATALAKTAVPAISWLKEKGVKIIKAGPDGLRKNALAPPGVKQTGYYKDGKPYWKGRSGDAMLTTLSKVFRECGGKVLYGTRAVDLIQGCDGECVGVIVENYSGHEKISAKNTVIADGGFQSNLELLRKHITERPESIMQRNSGSGNGDGISLAEKVGARLTGTESFYGHLLYKAAMNDDRFWPYPVIDSLAVGSIIVDEGGRRFCDEGLGGVYVTNQVAKLKDPLAAVVVFDADAWNAGPGKDWLIPANPYFLKAGGELIEAESISKLANILKIQPETLHSTIDSYNYFLESGCMRKGEVERTTGNHKAWPIKKPPFYAIEVCAGITYTMGGICTNENGQVLNVPGDVIKGLFAAGACTGGLEGGAYSGYSGGLSKALVFGLRAGEFIAGSNEY